jgi:hypothetical protein
VLLDRPEDVAGGDQLADAVGELVGRLRRRRLDPEVAVEMIDPPLDLNGPPQKRS